MESTQREILAVLLERIFDLGLISQTTFQSAGNSLASRADFPELLRDPVCLEGGAVPDGGSQNTG